MKWGEKYTETMQTFLALKQQKALRRQQIEAEIPTLMPPVLGASIEHVVNGRVATDPLSRDLQVLMDRALAEATAYGIGSIITNLAFLARQEEEK